MLSIAIPELSTWEGKLFAGVLGFSWATFMWENYLSYRQRCVCRDNVVAPKEAESIIDQKTYEKARTYSLDKSNFGFVQDMFHQCLNTVVMVYGGLPALWRAGGWLAAQVGYGDSTSEMPQTLAFVSIGAAVSFVMGLPWSAYFTFGVEQKHGFNKQTVPFFIKDSLKKFAVMQVISMPIVCGIVYIIQIGGDYLCIYLWGFTTALMLFLMTVYPDFIAPLFDKYEPLPEGELRQGIETLAKSVEFPLTKLYVVEGSKRSAHSNAYMYGFYKNKRIVLYDTLLADYTPLNPGPSDDKPEEEKEEKKKTGCENDEVLAVLGHELGHWKLNHVLQGIAISQVSLLLMLAGFGALNGYGPLFSAFGFDNKTRPAFVGFVIVMQFVFAPYSEVVSFLMTALSRHNEFAADAFAAAMGRGAKLRTALVKLNNDNLSFPVYDYLYSTWHHSHPPVLQRLAAIREIEEKQTTEKKEQ